MRRFQTHFPRTREEFKNALFSTHNHPSRVIEDAQLLHRYQSSRVLIALLGGLLGASGLGFSFSMNGTLGMGTEVGQIGLLGLLGAVLAVVLVLVPLPAIIRWVLAIALVLVPVFLMGVDIAWQLTAGAIGVVVSLVVASLIFFLVSFGRRFREELFFGLGTILMVVLVLGAPAPASAQANACVDSTFSASSGSVAETWTSASPAVLPLEVSSEGTNLTLSGDVEVDSGTVVVELVETRPFPFVSAGEPQVVYTTDFVAGSFGPHDLAFVANGEGELRLRDGNEDIGLSIEAGEGLYRVVIMDAFSGGSCEMYVKIRILASPLDTPLGRAVAMGTVASLAFAAAAVGGGVVFDPARRVGPPLSGIPSGSSAVSEEGGSHRSPSRLRVSDGPRERGPGSQSSDGSTWSIEVSFDLEEEERDPHTITMQDSGFCSLVSISAPVTVGNRWVVPVELKSDPRHVDRRRPWATFALATKDGATICSFTISQSGADIGGPWGLESAPVVTPVSTSTGTESGEEANVAEPVIDLDELDIREPSQGSQGSMPPKEAT